MTNAEFIQKLKESFDKEMTPLELRNLIREAHKRMRYNQAFLKGKAKRYLNSGDKITYRVMNGAAESVRAGSGHCSHFDSVLSKEGYDYL